MGNHSKDYREKKLQNRCLETTADRITGKAGLALFVAYLHRIEILPRIERWYGAIRKNGKGLKVVELFKQVTCFMVDGISRRLTYFDHLAEDEGYAGIIETEPAAMASSPATTAVAVTSWPSGR